jgi:hypothetical protein
MASFTQIYPGTTLIFNLLMDKSIYSTYIFYNETIYLYFKIYILSYPQRIFHIKYEIHIVFYEFVFFRTKRL